MIYKDKFALSISTIMNVFLARCLMEPIKWTVGTCRGASLRCKL